MATMNSGLGGPAGYGENVFSSTPKEIGSNNDDGAVKIDVTSVFADGLDFFGTNYTEIFVNSNGAITFGTADDSYNINGMADFSVPALAPFFTDIDITSGGEIYWDFDATNGKITITWNDVQEYGGGLDNSFQVVLTDTGGGNFNVEYIYEDISFADVGGDIAVAGFTDGAGATYELEFSGNASNMLNYESNNFDNGDPSGTFSFDVVSGAPDILAVNGTSGDDAMGVGYTDADGDEITDGNDVIDGGAGADTIDGGGGDDLILGGDGDDSITGGDGTAPSYQQVEAGDNFQGTGGQDFFEWTAPPGGSATIRFNNSPGAGDGDGAADYVLVSNTNNSGTLTIGDFDYGTDKIVLQEDYVGINASGSTGVRDITVTYANGNQQTFKLYYDNPSFNPAVIFTTTPPGGTSDDTIDAGAGHDVVLGGDGDDVIEGGVGDDTLTGGAGADSITGGDGDDLFRDGSAAASPTPIYTEMTASTGTQVFTGTGGGSDFNGSVASDVNTVSLSTYNGFSGYWVGNSNTIEAHTHTFTQEVAGAQIQFTAVNGGETVSIKLDGQLIDLNDAIANGTVTFNGGNDFEITPGGAIALHSNGLVSDVGTLTINVPFTTIDVVNALSGGNGFLYSLDVDTNPVGGQDDDGDTLDGGDGADTFAVSGDLDSDTITGGESAGDDDVLDLSGVTDAVYLTYSGDEAGTITGGGDTLSFSQIEEIVLTDQDDLVNATSAPGGITLDTGGGNDTVQSGAGDDSIHGGAGNDLLDGAAGADTLHGGAGNDSIGGAEGNDVIDGGAGNDVIGGEAGNDTLHGGAGDDGLYGGGGDDVFMYQPGGGHDTISDFNGGNTGGLNDGSTTNNDFVDLSGYYDHLKELYADQADDGILNQSNTLDADGNAVDYGNNTQFGAGNSLTFTGATADDSTFTQENTGVVCFTSGTAIRTPRGDVLIDELRVGDHVSTMDNGPQEIRWIGRRDLDQAALRAKPTLRPVLIPRGVLGVARDLLVSRQHGMLLGRDNLARAIHLCGGPPGIRIANGKRKVTYIHLMFDAHQIIFAEGAPSESFYPGPMAMQMMGLAPRIEVLELFPALRDVSARTPPEAAYGALARTFLRRRELPYQLKRA